MARRKNTLSQSLDIAGSQNLDSTRDLTDETNSLGAPISGQTGSAASITGVSGSDVTIIGLSGITSASVGRSINIEGAATAANNGTFLITEVLSPSSVIYTNASAVAPDGNNGSITWTEREPYSLEDDLNFARTDREQIKGVSYADPVPTYVRPDDTLTDTDANLTNIAGKTTDAKALIEPRLAVGLSVSTNDTLLTLLNPGNLQHATSTDLLGVPVFDGYDIGNVRACFVAIMDADADGYGDGAELRVLGGLNEGERIFGLTQIGGSASPDSVEVAFYSAAVEDMEYDTITPYTWESGQPNTINLSYAYRQRLDLLDETALRDLYLIGSLSDIYGTGGGSGSAGTGITEDQHKTLRHLIHFIDSGPGGGFVSGSFYELLPAGSPFPTSYIWWESSSKIKKIVELTVTRGDRQQPVIEEWKMYASDGSTVLETVTDTISYSGPFVISTLRTIS